LSAVVIQPLEALVAPVATQQVVTQQVAVLIEDIGEDELEAVFEARGETAEDKVDKVDETKLPELLAGEVIRMGLSTVPTL
jgi:hypothetical protein